MEGEEGGKTATTPPLPLVPVPSPPLPLTIAPFRVIDREAKEIESAIADLQRQKSEAEKTMLSLRRTFLELEEDVKCKKNTLNVDNS